MKKLDSSYWNNHYLNNNTGWDLGYASPPITDYFDQVDNKKLKILIPGAGKAWEAEYLWKKGFRNVYVLDYSQEAISEFEERVPEFPKSQIIIEDFFKLEGGFDIIVEQTFFCSLSLELRSSYVSQMNTLLKPKGKLIGLLFNHKFKFQGPPYGGTPQFYKELFHEHFEFTIFEIAHNSIKPRAKREHFCIFTKK